MQPRGKLSIKFNVDGYNDDSTSATFTLGRVVGSRRFLFFQRAQPFPGGAFLQPVPGVQPQIGVAYALIDGDSLLLDLGNTLPTQSPGGPIATNLGRLYLPALIANSPVSRARLTTETPELDTQIAGIADR